MANKDTKWVYLKGTCEYYRNKTPNEYGAYSLRIKLDDPEAYKATGIQVAMDEEDCVWFRRPKVKLIKNDLVEFGPPLTVDNSPEPQPLDALVGKGSKIEAKVKYYPTAKGVGHTLEAVKVFELVPVEGEFKNY